MRTIKLGRFLAIYALVGLFLTGCAQLGLAPASTFEERLAYAVSQNAAVRQAAASSLEAGDIQVDDAQRILKVTDQVRDALNAAKLASGVGDTQTAEGRLQLATALLLELQRYLRAQS